MQDNMRAFYSSPEVPHRKLARLAAGFVFTQGMRTYQASIWLWGPPFEFH